MANLNRQIRLASRPRGAPTQANFEIVETPIPEPGEGEVLTRTLFLSLDPYMRGRMNETKSYSAPVPIGGIMVGQTVGEVVVSRDPGFAAGDIVVGFGNWQDYAAIPAKTLRKLSPALAPVSTALGVFGMPGHTAYVGLLDIGQPKPGETVVVSSAAGAVGSLVGQIAKIKGCRVVGIAGGALKCRYVVEELGFDAGIDHRAADFAAALARACPNGVDIDFENVGGAILQAIWPLLNDFARVVVCGLVAHYNDPTPAPSADFRAVLTKRLTVRGFIIIDHHGRFGDFLRDVSAWQRDGRVKYREDIVDGLEHAPEAFIGLLQGHNFGKLIVRVAQQR
jgi:NADPH-dependent curcumin reductase